MVQGRCVRIPRGRKRYGSSALLLAGTIILLTAPANAQRAAALPCSVLSEITVSVTNGGLSGVPITYTLTGPANTSQTTNSAMWTFAGLDEGDYTVCAEADGFEKASVLVTLTCGDTEPVPVELVTLPLVSETYNSTDVPKAVPDPGTVSSIIIVPAAKSVMNITDVNVTLNITHGWVPDLDIFLTSPSGTTVELLTDVGNDDDDNLSNTTLDDEAPTSITAGTAPFTGLFQPEGSLSDFDGETPIGTWTLQVSDDEAIIPGTINSWSLTLEPPPDTDEDGVPNGRDLCPNTPAGWPVDADGCPLDTDGDSVPDGQDQCPNTPAGWPVDANGCPLDTDGDSVPDGQDQCADTPSGTAVDAVGCPLPPPCTNPCDPACPNYDPSPCGPCSTGGRECAKSALEFFPLGVYEEVLPGDRVATPDQRIGFQQSLAVRVNGLAQIDPASVWVTVEGDQGYSAIGGVWQATIAENNRDGWIVFVPNEPYAPGENLVVTAGGLFVDGVEFGPAIYEFGVSASTEIQTVESSITEITSPEPLDTSLALAVTAAYRVRPAGVFLNPVTVEIPIPAGYDVNEIEAYYFSESERHRAWYAVSQVTGLEVPDSREIAHINGVAFLQITLNHSGSIQLGVPNELRVASLGSIPIGVRGGFGTWALFIVTLLVLSAGLSKWPSRRPHHSKTDRQ